MKHCHLPTLLAPLSAMNSLHAIRSACLMVAVWLAGTGVAADGAEPADFENHIAPILQQRCVTCHNTKKKKGELDLSTKETLLRGGENGNVIVPGNPDESYLLERVRNGEMPPEDKGGGKRLSQDQIELLSTWIQNGARWPAGQTLTPDAQSLKRAGSDWWSLRPVRRPALPPIDTDENASPIDAFVSRKIRQRGLSPLGPTDRRTLIRRATFDLIGLPPTPEEVAAFLSDESPDALQRVVDRLLASAHYGERWGRHWLDVVRYADTAGETADYPVPEAYRYRNYVIDAFNSDKPYDVFIREQIAGDILARQGWAEQQISRSRYAELITATGFLAISRRFGFDTERYEYLTIQDTIDTIGQAVQGLALGCARCHDHKYDPVTTEDYYALYGIFASTRYAFAGSERLPATRVMTPLIPCDEATLRWNAWQSRIADLQRQLRSLKPAYKLPRRPEALRPLSGLDGDFELQAPPSGGSLGRPANPWQFAGTVHIQPAAQSPFSNIYPPGSVGAKVEKGQTEVFLGRGLVPAFPQQDGAPLFFGIDFRNTERGAKYDGTYRVYLGRRGGKTPALDLFVSQDALFVRNGDTVEKVHQLETNTWYQLRLALDLTNRSYRGSLSMPEKSDDVTNFDGKVLSSTSAGEVDYIMIDGRGHVAGPLPGFEFDNIALARVAFPQPISTVKPDDEPDSKKAEEPPAEPKTSIEQLELRIHELLNTPPYPQAYAVWEGTPHDVHVHQRGESEKPGALTNRRFLRVLGGDTLPADTNGSGRLELADWLTRSDNPLTARVMVNRIWQHHFGNGLVRTENDFGTRGRPPKHPQLLDWLAATFIENRWSIKTLHRMIMLSDIYQRSSGEHPEAAAADPDNKLLARFPRRRLDAESIRDAMLALSGQFDRSRGGPHPFPELTRASFTQHNPFRGRYATDRRSVYLMTARLKRGPLLALFDGADTNASTPKRSVTTVPTQALFMMNNPLVHRLSEGFAGRLLAGGQDDRSSIEMAFQMALARPPVQEETDEAVEFLGQYRQQLIDAGTGEDQDESQLKIWTALARSLFARNEFVYID